MANEKTGAKVASIAGRIQAGLKELPPDMQFWLGDWFSVAEVRALAASALTQAPDRTESDNVIWNDGTLKAKKKGKVA